MFNPVGAIIQAILMIYDTVMFFIENINRILDFVEAVINSFYKIATGAIGDAANWIEKALANTIPIIIGFLARLLGISGITDKIVSTIKKIQSKVDKAVDKVIEKVVGGIKKLVGAGKAAVKAVLQWWKVRKAFTGADHKSHTITADRQDKRAVIVVRSAEQPLKQVILVQPEPKRGKLLAKYAEIEGLFAGSEPEEKQQAERHNRVKQVIDEIATELGPGEVRPTVVTHAVTSGGRPLRVIADTLTGRAGNTAGSPSQGGVQFKDFISALVEPRPQEQHRGGETTTRAVFSMFSSAHLLAGRLHGPADSWNLANTGKGINKGMIGPEKTAETLKDKGAELKYVTSIEYYSDFPPTDRATLAAGTPEQKIKWLGGLVAKKYSVQVSILKPAPGEEGDQRPGDVKASGSFDDGPNFLSGLKLVGGPIPPTTAERLLPLAKATAESTPGGRRVRGIVFLARELRIDTNAASRALEELAKQGALEQRADGRYYLRG
jgi:hypothetical protein